MMYKKLFKPFFDFLIGCFFSLVLLPLILLIIFAVVTESTGAPIFRQRRVGRGGKEFTIYKIRTMKKNSERGAYSTRVNDPRITKIGRHLRITSLDEIPQFWNLFLGNMSLIGPRPNVPAQRSLYTATEWELRNKLKPGITGLAQSTFRSSSTDRNRKRLDLFYAKHCCLYLDILILFRTVNILFKKGVQN